MKKEPGREHSKLEVALVIGLIYSPLFGLAFLISRHFWVMYILIAIVGVIFAYFTICTAIGEIGLAMQKSKNRRR